MGKITKISLGKNGPLVSKLGLGCMRMSSTWGNKAGDENESIDTIQMALDNGINFLNTGDFYGSGHNELLIGKAIKNRRDDAFISVKFGAIIDGGQMLGLDLHPNAIKNFINYSLVRLGIDTIEMLHQSRQIRAAGVNHEVVVIVHETVGQHDRIEPVHRLSNDCQKRSAIFVVLEDGFAPIAARGDVIDRTGKFNSEGACHGCITCTSLGKRQGLTPFLSHSLGTFAPYGSSFFHSQTTALSLGRVIALGALKWSACTFSPTS